MKRASIWHACKFGQTGCPRKDRGKNGGSQGMKNSTVSDAERRAVTGTETDEERETKKASC